MCYKGKICKNKNLFHVLESKGWEFKFRKLDVGYNLFVRVFYRESFHTLWVYEIGDGFSVDY